MENCNKKPTPPLFSEDWLNKWRREPKIEYGVDFGAGNCVSAEITVYLPPKDVIIKARIHALASHIYEREKGEFLVCQYKGIEYAELYEQITECLRQEVEFLKLLL